MIRATIFLCMLALSAWVSGFSKAAQADESIQQNFAHLQKANRDTHLIGNQKSARIASLYRAAFSSWQHRDKLNALGVEDLKLLYRAASIAAFYTYGESYLDDMRLDLGEIERRHAASQYFYSDMYQTLIQNRQFTAARKLLSEHPSSELDAIPPIRDVGHSEGNAPLELIVSPKQQQLTLTAVHLDPHVQIVVVGHPLCHFTQGAGHDIEIDPTLRGVFKFHSIWISPQDGNLDVADFQQWNRHHPDLPIAIVWKESEWPKVDYWGTPTFYFFKNGVLIEKLVGWAKAGSREDKKALVAALQKLGLLHQSADGRVVPSAGVPRSVHPRSMRIP